MIVRTVLAGRSLAVALLAAVPAALPAPARAQTIEFQGSAVVHGFTDACRNAGWYSGSQAFAMRYYPASLGDNPDHSFMSLHQTFGSLGYRLAGGRFDATARAVSGQAIFGSFWQFDNARVQFARQNPATLDAATTGPVRITGRIRNFDGAPQCTVRFDAVLMRTP